MRKLPLAILALAVLTTGCPSNGGGGSGSTCPKPAASADDADGDLLTDTREAFLGTDPQEADTDGDGFGDYAEDRAGTDPLSESSAPPATQVASIRQITSESELIGGPAAQGRVGDWLIENDVIRAIVQDVGREQMAIGKFGGGLIDADVIRASGPGMDRVGSVVGGFSLLAVANPDRVVVVSDGADGGPAILRTCGEELPFEYLDLEATVDSFGLGIAYESNRDYDVSMSTDFVLAPGSNAIEVITTVANHGATFNAPVATVMDSGAAEEVFLTNYQGFGALGIGDILTPQPPVRYAAFIGSNAAWGFVGEAEPNAAINIFGITAVVPGYTSPLDVITSNPEDEPTGGMRTFMKGGRVSWRRAIVITDGADATEGISKEYVDRHEPAATVHTGNVGDGTGPIAGARVVALKRGGTNDRAPLSVTQSDENGDYSFRLPDGDYYIAADVTGRDFPTFSAGEVAIETRTKQTMISAAEVVLANASALPDITFADEARLTVSVTDVATAAGVPAKITVVGTDPSLADWIFHDLKDSLPSSINIAYDSANGSFDVPLEPGNYDVYASRGMEWSLDVSPVTIVAGQDTSLSLSIGRVVNTPGWMSGDFHVHMMNSPDSGVTFAERVLSGVADGLDVIVATDHDFVTDLTPLISSMGLSSQIASTQGEEISTTAFGHFIAFPLTPDEDSATRGAYQWSGEAGALNAKSPEVMFTEIEANHPGPQVQLVCHPRGDPLTAYFDAVELNTITLATERDPEDMRIPRPSDYTEADTGLFYAGFDAQEVMNNPDESETRRNAWMNDVFSFLSHGLTVAAIGDSDSHSVFSSALGWPRTYVKLADDAPANFGAANQEAFAQAVKDGHATIANGPHLRVTAAGDDAGGPGDLVLPRAVDDGVTVTIELEMPDWISVDKVRLYMNTPNTGAPAGSAVETAPVAFDEFDVVLATTDAGFGLSKRIATITTDVPVSPNGDAWLVVTASGDATPTLFPVVPKNAKPFALANAIYLDGNRNGAWNAPGGVTAGVSLTATPKPERFEGLEILQNVDTIREQFHAIGTHDH